MSSGKLNHAFDSERGGTKDAWDTKYGSDRKFLTPVDAPEYVKPENNEKPEADDTNARPSYRRACKEWAENTCTNGVPNIPRSDSWLRRGFWILVVLSFTGITIWQIATLFMTYYQFPVTVTVNMTYQHELKFPAITICNMNPMRLSKVAQAGPQIQNLFPKAAGSGNASASTKGHERRQAMLDFADHLNDLPVPLRMQLGHQKEDMILECVYDGEECGPQNFTNVYNYLYGNCFSFNYGRSKHLKVHKSGPGYGLDLILYIEQEEYIEELTEGAGVRIELYSNNETPFPEDKGLLVPPGFQTEMSMRMVNITRKPAPFPSDCKTMTHNEAKNVNMFADYMDTEYSEQACFKTCYQRRLIEKCGCGDHRYPLHATALPQVNGTGARPCKSNTELDCEYGVYAAYQNDELNCDCSRSCEEIIYEVTPSMAVWPNYKFEQLIFEELAAMSSSVNQSKGQGNLGQNLIKLHIFFGEMNYEAITEQESYPLVNVISDLGGIIGLYLGLSFVALFELLEFFMDIIIITIRKCCSSKRPSPSVDPGKTVHH